MSQRCRVQLTRLHKKTRMTWRWSWMDALTPICQMKYFPLGGSTTCRWESLEPGQLVKVARDKCRGRYQSRVLFTEPRIKLLDNVVYELVIHIYQKIVFGELSLIMACIWPMALYADGSWFCDSDSDIYSLFYGLYSAPDFVPSCFITCIGNSFLRHVGVLVCFT